MSQHVQGIFLLTVFTIITIINNHSVVICILTSGLAIPEVANLKNLQIYRLLLTCVLAAGSSRTPTKALVSAA